MKKQTWEGWSFDRLERWLSVQMMMPRPGQLVDEPPLLSYFEASWLDFLDSLPDDRPMTTAEFAKLAFFAGAAQAGAALVQHGKEVVALKLDDVEAHEALEDLALEPIDYLRARGIPLP